MIREFFRFGLRLGYVIIWVAIFAFVLAMVCNAFMPSAADIGPL